MIGLYYNDDRLRAALAKAPGVINQHLGSGLTQAGGELAAYMRVEAPKGKSQLTNSINVLAPSKLERLIGPATNYAKWVEQGVKPGGKLAPFQQGSPLYQWVVQFLMGGARNMRRGKKGGQQDVEQAEWIALHVARKIRARGIPANPFIQRTFDAKRSRVVEVMRLSTEAGLRAVFG